MNEIVVHNPPAKSSGESITRILTGAQNKANVIVMVYNDQDDAKTDTGDRYIQMGQRLWVSLLKEVNYVLEQYEITGHKLTGITVWHSPPDDIMQSSCWSLTVQIDRVESLRNRLFRLVTKSPYNLANGPAVLVARSV